MASTFLFLFKVFALLVIIWMLFRILFLYLSGGADK